jgi:hypothetical protein
VASTFGALEECFYRRVAGKLPNALLLLTADHGLTPVDPATTVYLNTALPDLPGLLKTTRRREPIPFGGSGRDLFLYVRDGHLDALEVRLTELLAGRAEVWRTRELAGAGLFGPGPFDRLLPRAGDLAVLPYAGQTVYWLEEGRFAMKHKAGHGGLTPEEMDTVLCALEL